MQPDTACAGARGTPASRQCARRDAAAAHGYRVCCGCTCQQGVPTTEPQRGQQRCSQRHSVAALATARAQMLSLQQAGGRALRQSASRLLLLYELTQLAKCTVSTTSVPTCCLVEFFDLHAHQPVHTHDDRNLLSTHPLQCSRQGSNNAQGWEQCQHASLRALHPATFTSTCPCRPRSRRRWQALRRCAARRRETPGRPIGAWWRPLESSRRAAHRRGPSWHSHWRHACARRGVLLSGQYKRATFERCACIRAAGKRRRSRCPASSASSTYSSSLGNSCGKGMPAACARIRPCHPQRPKSTS